MNALRAIKKDTEILKRIGGFKHLLFVFMCSKVYVNKKGIMYSAYDLLDLCTTFKSFGDTAVNDAFKELLTERYIQEFTFTEDAETLTKYSVGQTVDRVESLWVGDEDVSFSEEDFLAKISIVINDYRDRLKATKKFLADEAESVLTEIVQKKQLLLMDVSLFYGYLYKCFYMESVDLSPKERGQMKHLYAEYDARTLLQMIYEYLHNADKYFPKDEITVSAVVINKAKLFKVVKGLGEKRKEKPAANERERTSRSF